MSQSGDSDDCGDSGDSGDIGDVEVAGVNKASALSVGQVLTAQRTILAEDIAAFASLVGDEGRHHVSADRQVMAHGLLTASLATQIGGRLDYIARRMSWEFLRPVWEGETITARVTVRALERKRSGTGIEFGIVIVNQDGDEVLRGDSTGVVRDSA
ncbi:enoyl-CoA hydratase [Streptomyces sp. HC44]|uniref:Enoyl-CoA hydratase n=1 Tax=Streptomyces scabichelini TaxID=2711217 RepID=A0A6G4UYA4_9ACTN|nr:enoyl-CoA hydratase [Streptomyces scabichelini]NGO06758.1 enoyl-CoA hydratase [Streptomyces scabichelini]